MEPGPAAALRRTGSGAGLHRRWVVRGVVRCKEARQRVAVAVRIPGLTAALREPGTAGEHRRRVVPGGPGMVYVRSRGADGPAVGPRGQIRRNTDGGLQLLPVRRVRRGG